MKVGIKFHDPDALPSREHHTVSRAKDGLAYGATWKLPRREKSLASDGNRNPNPPPPIP